MKKRYLYTVIAVLILLNLFFVTCNSKTQLISDVDTFTVEKIQWDTFTKKDTVYRPKWRTTYLRDTLVDSFFVDRLVPVVLTEDSMYVVNDSTNIKVIYRIYSRDPLIKIEKTLDYKVQRKEIERTVIQKVFDKHAYYAGGGVVAGRNINAVYVDGLYQRNNKVIYNIGLGVASNSKPVIKAGITWKINQ